MHGGQLKWKFARALKLTVQPIAEAVEQAGQGMGQATLAACQLSSSGLHFMCRQFLIIKITAPAAGRRQDNKQVRCLLCQCVDERALGVAEGKGGGGGKRGRWKERRMLGFAGQTVREKVANCCCCCRQRRHDKQVCINVNCHAREICFLFRSVPLDAPPSNLLSAAAGCKNTLLKLLTLNGKVFK